MGLIFKIVCLFPCGFCCFWMIWISSASPVLLLLHEMNIMSFSCEIIWFWFFSSYCEGFWDHIESFWKQHYFLQWSVGSLEWWQVIFYSEDSIVCFVKDSWSEFWWMLMISVAVFCRIYLKLLLLLLQKKVML